MLNSHLVQKLLKIINLNFKVKLKTFNNLDSENYINNIRIINNKYNIHISIFKKKLVNIYKIELN